MATKRPLGVMEYRDLTDLDGREREAKQESAWVGLET